MLLDMLEKAVVCFVFKQPCMSLKDLTMTVFWLPILSQDLSVQLGNLKLVGKLQRFASEVTCIWLVSMEWSTLKEVNCKLQYFGISSNQSHLKYTFARHNIQINVYSPWTTWASFLHTEFHLICDVNDANMHVHPFLWSIHYRKPCHTHPWNSIFHAIVKKQRLIRVVMWKELSNSSHVNVVINIETVKLRAVWVVNSSAKSRVE